MMVGENVNVVVSIRNVERLISRCEDILGGKMKIRGQKWRIQKYVQSLNEMITELDTKHSGSVNADQLRSFKQRLSVIQEITRQEQMKNQKQKEPETSSVSPERFVSPSAVSSITPLQRSLDTPDVHGSGLLRRTLSRNYREMREELFTKDDSYSSPYQSSAFKESGNVETVLAKHQEMQEKIAQDMILIARSLKDHSLAARDIIKGDKEVLKKTIDIADTNIEGVNRETGRLKEKNRSCSWGTWILLVVVFVVFIQMIIFMRMFPKPKR